ncbi:MAG: hypothetical protein WC967_01845 [Balneolaceae bacterium]
MNNRLLTLFLLILCFSSTSLFAQDNISSDRPGAGYGTFVVPTQTLFLEAGGFLNKNINDFGQLYLRTGLMNNLEVQFNAGSLLFIDGVDKAQVSSQSIALKYALGSFQNDRLNLSLFSRTNLPFLNSNYEYYLTRFMVLADFSINDSWALNSNFGYGDFVNGIENGSFNFNLTPSVAINNQTAAYFGYAVTFDENFSSDIVEGGVTYLLDSSFQLDAGLIYGNGDNLYFTFGIAKRF